MFSKTINKAVGLSLIYLLLLSFPAGIWSQVKVRKGGKKTDTKSTTTLKNAKKGKSLTGKIEFGAIPNVLKKQLDKDEIQGVPWRGEPGITETVEQIMKREKENPMEPYNGIPKYKRQEIEREKMMKKPHPLEAEMDKKFKSVIVSESNSFLPQTAGTSIAGPDIASAGFVPPDSMGDVGPTQILMHANGRIRVYNKATGALGSLDVTDSTFWNSVRNGAGVSDPHIEYDRHSGRWFLCMINVQAAPNRVLVAVSSGAIITNTSSFTFFQFTHDAVGVTPNVDTGGFADYPTWGIDNNAAYMGMNIFNAAGTALIGTTVYVINKANLLAGTLTVTPFRQIGAANGTGSGPWTPQAADNDDASFTTGYFVGVDNASFSLLNVRRVSTPGGVPTISGNLNITAPTTRFPIFQLHLGAAANRRLDSLDDRIFSARIQRNEITGTSTLVAAHNIQVDTTGTGSTTGGRNGSRWYEIGGLTTTPALVQSGTLFDSAVTNPNGFWIPSIAMSGQGHMAIASSSAGNNRRAEIFASGRLRTDALGSLQAPTQIQASSTNYNAEAVDGQRWGDYSQTSVDPCDNQTFWTFQEYCDATNSWRMRAIQLRAATPPTTLTASPPSINTGVASVNVVVSGTSVNGTEFYDNPTGFVCNANCSTTGTGTCRIQTTDLTALTNDAPATVNSTTFNSVTQVTLNLNTIGATPGNHTFQICNPDGQCSNVVVNLIAPTASTAPLGGKISNSAGIGLENVTVVLQDAVSGETFSVRSGTKGEYVFGEALVGRSYIVTPEKEGYTFNPVNRVISLLEEQLDVNFTANSTFATRGTFNDFDGDGKTDFAVFRPNERRWYVLQSSDGALKSEVWGASGDLLTPADFDGDGKTDFAVYRASEGTWYIKQSSDNQIVIRKFGLTNDLPVAGFFDGDGRADIAVFRGNEGKWYVLNSADNSTAIVSWGTNGDRPLVGDFDGDGKSDMSVYRAVEGRWYTRFSTGNSQNSIQFGALNDKIAPADYDGDGKTDIGIYRPESGAWFILNSRDSSANIQLFGLNNDQVVSGDYNGDGKADIAVFRSTDSTWYVLPSGGGFIGQKWGTSGDIPAVPNFIR